MSEKKEDHDTRVDDAARPRHVTITIDGKEYSVHPGNHPVVELKNLGGVPKDWVLCQIIQGQPPLPLDDKAHLDIRGGEVFASHQPSGGAS